MATSSTIGRNNRLGLLLKQYYDDPSGTMALGGERDQPFNFSIDKLEKLSTEPLMAKAVESLRSYKEAESDLRMLLYNNSDKLLEAVQVVSAIRDGSDALCQHADTLVAAACGEKSFISSQGDGNSHHSFAYVKNLKKKSVVNGIEKLEKLPKWLKNSSCTTNIRKIESRIAYFLTVSEKYSNSERRYSVIDSILQKARSVIDNDLVAVLLNESAASSKRTGHKTRLNLLLDLFPSGHSRRSEILQQFIELEIAGFEESLSKQQSAEDSLTLFNAVLDTLFLAHELGVSDLVEKLKEDLVARASRKIVDSIAPLEQMSDFIEEALAAHARIPHVSPAGIAEFRKQALVAWIRSRFAEAAKIFIAEDLPSLLASEAYGACCDVVHTRCCAALVSVHQCLSTETVSDIFHREISEAIREYYGRSTLAAPTSDDMDQTTVWLVHLLKVNKTIFNRKTVSRSLNALNEMFAQDFVASAEDSSVIALNVFRIIKLIGESVSCSIPRLVGVVEKIAQILESSGENGGRFSLPSELNAAETVHARKLIFPSNDHSALVSLEMAVSIVLCVFLKNSRELGGQGLKLKSERDKLADLAAKYIGQPDSDHMQAVSAMLKDL